MREVSRALVDVVRPGFGVGQRNRLTLCAVLAVAITLAAHTIAGAAEAPDRTAEQAARQTVAVIGDSLAQDLWNGLHKLYRGAENVEILRFTKVSSGLVRDDVFDWNKRIKQFTAENNFDTAIVLMGGNDRQVITVGGKRLNRFGAAWTEEYGRRVDDMIVTLKTRTNAIYWLGLPIVRSKRMARDYVKLNKVYRSQAEANGITYVDTWQLFDTKDGKYTSFGLDVKGVKRRLRKDDGLHFTVAGKLVFAREIVRILRKEVSVMQPVLPPPPLAKKPSG